MTSYEKLINAQKINSSMLCVGLDPDINKLPVSYNKRPEEILRFNQAIIEATKDIACCYKINFAFFEQYGITGYEILKKTFEAIPDWLFTIADAKRGDIGNTSAAYANSVLDYFKADSITVSPYMGKDSVTPFLNFQKKMVFILALTSNEGSGDFQRLISDGQPVYSHVVNKSKSWGGKSQIGYVVGATHPDELKVIRKLIPENCLLIPGIGAQGGDIEATIKANDRGPAIINVSRAIIYASNGDDFAEKAREKALEYREMMKK